MSTHIVEARDPEKYVCRVGYDPAIDSYMVYVARPLHRTQRGHLHEENNGHTILWEGTSPGEIDTVEDVARLLEPYAELPEELYETLRSERVKRSRL